MIVTYNGNKIQCGAAIKDIKNNVVLLQDDDGKRVAEFGGIEDFSLFALEGGEWSVPDPMAQEQTDALMLDHEERLIYLELGVNNNAVSGS